MNSWCKKQTQNPKWALYSITINEEHCVNIKFQIDIDKCDFVYGTKHKFIFLTFKKIYVNNISSTKTLLWDKGDDFRHSNNVAIIQSFTAKMLIFKCSIVKSIIAVVYFLECMAACNRICCVMGSFWHIVQI